MIGFDAEANIIKHYRVDKMQKMQILMIERKGQKAFEETNLTAFGKKTF